MKVHEYGKIIDFPYSCAAANDLFAAGMW